MEKTQRFDRKLVFENGREFLGAGFGSPREALYQCSFDTRRSSAIRPAPGKLW